MMLTQQQQQNQVHDTADGDILNALSIGKIGFGSFLPPSTFFLFSIIFCTLVALVGLLPPLLFTHHILHFIQIKIACYFIIRIGRECCDEMKLWRDDLGSDWVGSD